MYKLCVYVPTSHLDAVKSAIFAAGAGRVGAYTHCCWEVQGVGQFMPRTGAKPFLGRVGELERVAEYRLETVVPLNCITDVVNALRQAHPYEEPAYDVMKLEAY
ncbi:YqfO family protein [Simiduia curdlanivorans]|uniref:NGG1p interacting factor NIF3 n=1 Tax=Simiduia curdlanivorans TaxID=1492769 RepID=A0ABV8V9M1_9GAMM|nr:YqfO family protein [Simiduia curdlanivorans]MDN3639762.1 YqfO family protein [Simiduia curdlanivorans]